MPKPKPKPNAQKLAENAETETETEHSVDSCSVHCTVIMTTLYSVLLPWHCTTLLLYCYHDNTVLLSWQHVLPFRQNYCYTYMKTWRPVSWSWEQIWWRSTGPPISRSQAWDSWEGVLAVLMETTIFSWGAGVLPWQPHFQQDFVNPNYEPKTALSSFQYHYSESRSGGPGGGLGRKEGNAGERWLVEEKWGWWKRIY